MDSVKVLKLHYGGKFVYKPKIEYVGGKIAYIDGVDIDEANEFKLLKWYDSVEDNASAVKFYCCPPNTELDKGLFQIRCSDDILLWADFYAKEPIIELFGENEEEPLQVILPKGKAFFKRHAAESPPLDLSWLDVGLEGSQEGPTSINKSGAFSEDQVAKKLSPKRMKTKTTTPARKRRLVENLVNVQTNTFETAQSTYVSQSAPNIEPEPYEVSQHFKGPGQKEEKQHEGVHEAVNTAHKIQAQQEQEKNTSQRANPLGTFDGLDYILDDDVFFDLGLRQTIGVGQTSEARGPIHTELRDGEDVLNADDMAYANSKDRADVQQENEVEFEAGQENVWNEPIEDEYVLLHRQDEEKQNQHAASSSRPGNQHAAIRSRPDNDHDASSSRPDNDQPVISSIAYSAEASNHGLANV